MVIFSRGISDAPLGGCAQLPAPVPSSLLKRGRRDLHRLLLPVLTVMLGKPALICARPASIVLGQCVSVGRQVSKSATKTLPTMRPHRSRFFQFTSTSLRVKQGDRCCSNRLPYSRRFSGAPIPDKANLVLFVLRIENGVCRRPRLR